MDQFIGTLIFVLPGLISYYLLQALGQSPVQKHNNFEQLSISTLLWVPVVSLFLVIHNLVIVKINFLDAYSLNNKDEILKATESSQFIAYFLACSIVIGFLFAFLWAYLSKYLFQFINFIRRKSFKIADFSRGPSVWDEIFNIYGSKVVEISKLDKPDEKIIGCLTKSSRALELERSISVDDIDYFTMIVNKYKPALHQVFIDVKAGLVIKIFNPDDIKKAQLDENFSSSSAVVE